MHPAQKAENPCGHRNFDARRGIPYSLQISVSEGYPKLLLLLMQFIAAYLREIAFLAASTM